MLNAAGIVVTKKKIIIFKNFFIKQKNKRQKKKKGQMSGGSVLDCSSRFNLIYAYTSYTARYVLSGGISGYSSSSQIKNSTSFSNIIYSKFDSLKQFAGKTKKSEKKIADSDVRIYR